MSDLSASSTTTEVSAKERMEGLLAEVRDLIQSEGWPSGRPTLALRDSEALARAAEDGNIHATCDEMAYWHPNHNILIVAPSVELAEVLNEMPWGE